ncbi:hypothetical protein QN277_016844 [Acacia crassicarpa]|uniref:F-box domain-containing protein n=1 Tax=Acacia crassicarpa TaxID=499986 RepID=A0AAE1MXR1_9FABA|nr:hypothetical protein QN277_016844 [Acacia crassicarpa]
MAQNLDRLKDVVPDILSRLPVKSLRRFACVNKSWYNLIKSPDFISKHLHTFNNRKNSADPINLLVNRMRPATFGTSGIHQKAFVSLLSLNPINKNASLSLLDLIYNHNEVSHLEIFGPCNGLYYFHSDTNLIVNPSMREFIVLPNIPAPPDTNTYSLKHHTGFGFDPNTNDYKVIMIMDTWRRHETGRPIRLPWRIEIYSLNSHCWRNVDCTLPSVPIGSWSWIDAFVRGAFHWWAFEDKDCMVHAFDMQNERFQTFRLPNVQSSDEDEDEDYYGTVAKFRESLAVIIKPMRGAEDFFDLWVMEDYSDDASWTKDSIIGPIVRANQPLAFLEEKNLFVVEDENKSTVFYDLQTKEIMHTEFHGEEALQAVVYMESLISLRRNNENPQAGASFFRMVPDPLFEDNSG